MWLFKKKKEKPRLVIWVTIMARFGDVSEGYVLGVSSTEEKARMIGSIEETFRGGKYKSFVQSYVLDDTEFDVLRLRNETEELLTTYKGYPKELLEMMEEQ